MITPQQMSVKEILESSVSLFIYHNMCDKAVSSKSKNLSISEVIDSYDRGKFTDSDLQIANIVASHVFSNEGMIGNAIKQYNKLSTGDGITLMEDVELNLKGRLTELVKSDILKKYNYVSLDAKSGKPFKHSYYLNTAHGYNFLKRLMNFDDNYDQYLAIRPIEEVFKYLGTVSVTQSLQKMTGFIKYKIDKPVIFKDKHIKSNIFGIVDIAKKNRTHRVVLEPLRLKFNKNRITADDWSKEIDFRFLILRNYTRAIISKYDYSIVIICEDLEGIKKACELTLKNMPEYLGNIFFTTDAAVNRYGAENSMLELKSNGDILVAKPGFI